ncbi:MAG: T9SS type A sorting domain-containing protein [Calditrichae bacterium]|nr:T9SS type A sorting domain-containing protein [Calditrichia bacterium]
MTQNRFYLSLLTILIWTPIFGQSLPTDSSTIFSGSGNCALCHTPGEPNLNALVSPTGEDISPPTFWRSTMMANAAKDPLFRAKVSAEVAENPALQAVIEDKCTTCHAPMGRTEAHANGAAFYSIAEMAADPLAMDGVSCTTCHQIKDVGLGTDSSFSGHYVIENDRIIYGPYHNMLGTPMQTTVNYSPQFGAQMTRSEICATCHTLFTPTLDDGGQIIGEFPEQTPYLEWKNSVYPAQNVECQTCHMPATDYPVTISNRPFFLANQSPFFLHYFVGGNTFMLNMLKSHGAEIGVTATADQFDSTIARTRRMLQNQTIRLSADYRWTDDDSLQIAVAIENLAGHKFPTGFPSRRAWIYLSVTDDSEDVLFESGAFDPQTGQIDDLESPFEPHHQLITDDDQVQIYQSVMGDVNGDVTHILLRGHQYLKDNRLPPQGFTAQGAYFDTTAIFGAAASDPNFNRSSVSEGTGADSIFYRIGELQRSETYQIAVKVYYQTASPEFVAHLGSYATPEVATFMGYYHQASKVPEMLDSLALITTPASLPDDDLLPQTVVLRDAYPNPFNPQTTIGFTLAQPMQIELSVFNISGQKVATLASGRFTAGEHSVIFVAENLASGVYFYRLQTETGIHLVKKALLLR